MSSYKHCFIALAVLTIVVAAALASGGDEASAVPAKPPGVNDTNTGTGVGEEYVA